MTSKSHLSEISYTKIEKFTREKFLESDRLKKILQEKLSKSHEILELLENRHQNIVAKYPHEYL